MFLSLPSVRAKLTALVSLSVVAVLAALPVLSWVMHRQLIDEVDDRVSDGERSFQVELDDDLSDVTVTAKVLAADPATQVALAGGSADAARAVAKRFLSVYPDIDVLFVDKAGRLVAQEGCARPRDDMLEMAGVRDGLAGKPFRGIVDQGCEHPNSAAPPAFVLVTPIEGGGVVVVCLPITGSFLENSGAKLGLELAIIDPKSGAPAAISDHFPRAAIGSATSASVLWEQGDEAWALQRFQPKAVVGPKGQWPLLIALDVADFRKVVRQNLLVTLAVLAIAALVSVIVGARMASIMSRAIARIRSGVQQLEQQEYAHVVAVKTGDELEDLATGFNTMLDGLKERDKLRTTMGKYMTASVMEHLMSGKVALGGETLTVTVLFSDIRSFTSISEKMEAHALVSLLNEYFTEMVTIVMQENGVVDKYIGDAIMAVFGAPVPRTDDAVNAVRAAVRMRKALSALNERLVARGVAPLRTGIGIHTGEVVAGNIGSEKRMEYTVIGDAVNLASRLESNTKELGVAVLISDDTYAAAKSIVVAKPIREITVKGRAQPVMTYEVLGLEGGPRIDDSVR